MTVTITDAQIAYGIHLSTLTTSARQPVDAEALITWALKRSGRLPWQNAGDRELAFDRGLTAKPHSAPHVTWGIAEACAGLSHRGRAVQPHMMPGPDAARVLAEIGLLEARTAMLVIACGRAGIRPDWMPGVEPRRVVKTKRSRRGHRKVAVRVWEPCEPAAIRAAREAYQCWHCGVQRVACALRGELDGWEIHGFAAPLEPWAAAIEKIA